MLGAICGDVIGSVYEGHNVKSKQFPLFSKKTRFTDDTVLTVAVADAILNKKYFGPTIHRYSSQYPKAGFGGKFREWMKSKHPKPYGSYGNGSAMRVSPIGFAFDSISDVMTMAEKTSNISHNHPDAIKGAQAIAVSIFLARNGKSKPEIKSYIETEFGYDLNRTIDSIRQTYKFDVSAKGSVPEAIIAFLESADYEDAIRTAISIGGDSDTIACMCGGISEAYYKTITADIVDKVKKLLPPNFLTVIDEFYQKVVK